MKKKTTHKRSFGGKLTGFANKDEARFEKAHLKAYLKGSTRFSMGYKDEEGNLLYWPVKEIWEKIESKILTEIKIDEKEVTNEK